MTAKKNKTGIRKFIDYLLLLVAIVILCLYGSKLYNAYVEGKLSESVLSRVVGTIQYDDVDNAIGEFVSDDFVLISYTKSQDTRKLENKLKKIVVDNNLQNNFYYLDATELMLENGYIKTLNNKFELVDKKIVALPALLYYKNGELVKVISSTKDTMMTSDDFTKLLDEYGFRA